MIAQFCLRCCAQLAIRSLHTCCEGPRSQQAEIVGLLGNQAGLDAKSEAQAGITGEATEGHDRTSCLFVRLVED